MYNALHKQSIGEKDMFAFDPKKLVLRYEYVASITEALGGSIRIVDADHYNETGEANKTTRLDIPYAVARAFKKRNKGRSTYLIPVKMAIVTYDGVIVQVEKAQWIQSTDEWVCASSRAIQILLDKVQNTKDGGMWCTDGQIIYKVPSHAFTLQYDHTWLSINKRFLAISVDSYKFSDMNDLKLLEMSHTRTIVGFVTNEQDIVYCPPIWKNVMEMRSKGASGVKVAKDNIDVDQNEQTGRFDILNQEFFVNLEFILTAGKSVGSLFGYEKIEFLQIQNYVIDLCAINLPKVDRAKRSTYDTGLQFMSCFAWLCGFIDQCENVNEFNKLRSVFKVLSMSGIFSKSQVEKSLNIAPPPLKTKEEARESVKATVDSLSFGAHIMNRLGKTAPKEFSVQQFITGTND